MLNVNGGNFVVIGSGEEEINKKVKLALLLLLNRTKEKREKGKIIWRIIKMMN